MLFHWSRNWNSSSSPRLNFSRGHVQSAVTLFIYRDEPGRRTLFSQGISYLFLVSYLIFSTELLGQELDLIHLPVPRPLTEALITEEAQCLLIHWLLQ